MKFNMKKQIKIWGMMLAATFALTNCTKENVQTPEVSEGTPFEIVASTVDTKTANDGIHTNWVAGDKINLFHAVTESTTYVNDGSFSISADGLATSTFTGTLAGELDPEEEYDWYALYPYSNKISTPAATTAGYTYIGYSTGLNQSGYNSMASLKGSICPLYGVVTAVTAGTQPVMEMKHLSSVVEIKVTNSNDEPLTITTASLTAQEDIVGSYFINFTESPVVYTPSGSNYVKSTATVNVSGGTALARGESATLYLAIKPFTAAAGQKLTLSVNGYAKEVTLSEAVSFVAGKIKTLNFAYDKAAESVVPGEYTIDWASAADWVENSTKYVSGYYMLKSVKNDGSTEPTVNGTANDCRVYAKGSITISHSAVNMKKIIFNISENGKKRLTDITASVGTVTVDATNWKVSWEGDAQAVTFTVGEKAVHGTDGAEKGGQLCFDSIDVESDVTDAALPVVLKKIEVKEMTTAYSLGQTFAFDGVVTAHYYNQEPKTVTAIEVSDVQMTEGNHRVTVTYSENGVTASTSYNIIVEDPNAVVGDSATSKVVFSEMGYANATDITTVSIGDVTATFGKGSNSNNGPKYYASGTAVRTYAGNQFTLTASKNITKIVLTFGSSDGTNTITTDNGNFDSAAKTWTGKSSSVKFTIGGTSGNRRIAAIEVTYEK